MKKYGIFLTLLLVIFCAVTVSVSAESIDIGTCRTTRIEDCIYSGKVAEPAVTVKNGTEVLTAGTDYTVSYENNIDAGTATAIVSGIGDYYGTLEANFTIEPRPAKIVSGSDKKSFDGTPLTCKKATITGFVKGEGVRIVYTGSQTEVGIGTNSFTIYPSIGTNLDNYAIIREEGTLRVVKSGLSKAHSVEIASTKHGSVALSEASSAANQTITMTLTPDYGYVFESVVVRDSKGSELSLVTVKEGEKYSFIMPVYNVTVYATFTADSGTIAFRDVTSSDYFFKAVNWAVEYSITSGADFRHFAPNAATTRAQMVTFLWRAAGKPTPSAAKCKFRDVSADDYFYHAVLWATERGITEGTSDTAFSPYDTVTRAQAVTFLWRYEGADSANGTMSFEDVAKTDYFADAVLWANVKGVTAGATETTFNPHGICTRGQVMTFLWRDLGKY